MAFQAAGYLSVAMFFFLSGFGLMISYKTKGQAYIRSMPKSKIIPFYCIILLVTSGYLILSICLGKEITLSLLIHSLTFGKTVIGNGWYLQVQLLLYIFVFVVLRLFRKSLKIQILLVAVLVLVLAVVLYLLKFSTTWYESVFAFIFGLLWSLYKEKIDKYLSSNKIYIYILIICFFSFGIFVLGSALLSGGMIKLFLKAISSILFVVLSVVTCYKISVCNAVSIFLGKISLEIYVVQGLFISLYHSEIINIENPYIFILLVVLSTFIGAFILHPIIEYIYVKFGGRKLKNQT